MQRIVGDQARATPGSKARRSSRRDSLRRQPDAVDRKSSRPSTPARQASFSSRSVSGSTIGRFCASSGSLSARNSAMRPSRSPIGSTPAHVTSPAAINVSRPAGAYPAMRAGRIDDSSKRSGQGRALQRFDRVEQRVEIGRSRRGESRPCQCVRKRASVCCSTGSTSRRSLASDLRRICRKISASHHSRWSPPGESRLQARAPPGQAAAARFPLPSRPTQNGPRARVA